MARKPAPRKPMSRKRAWFVVISALLGFLHGGCSVQPPADPLWLEQHEAERAEYWPQWHSACLAAHRIVVREDAIHTCPIGENNCLPDRSDWDFTWHKNKRTGESRLIFLTRHVFCARP